ncbi:cystatin-A1-like [Dendropsophus ebraccatus]|uniref:cystatin-A1-like n=1 Tax=Dendropsophus ebraccatus TaxID=150705 RepID=UPI0038320AD1
MCDVCTLGLACRAALTMESKVLLGGMGAEKPAIPEIQAVCDSVKTEFLKRCGVNAAKFEAVKYRQQVVAGMNYLVKVWLGGDEYCHVLIHEPLPCTGEKPSLGRYQLGKTEQDAMDCI